jgi:hypothetical protein
MTTLFLVTLLLSTDPSIIHDDVRQLCPPGGSLASVQDAPLPCLQKAIQRTTAEIQGALQRLRQSLIDTLQRRIPELH